MDLIERQRVQVRRHPWEVARAGFYLRLLDRAGLLVAGRYLDAGAGDAWLGGELHRRLPAGAEVVCWDVHYGAEDLSRPGPGPGVELTAERPAGCFDGILLLDVIEHVEDDGGFVADLVERSLVPAGWVLVGVPAHQRLFSAHDRALRHHRRYSPSQLRSVLEGAGLRVAAAGSVFHALAAVRALQVARERATGKAVSGEGVGGWRGSARPTALLTALLDWEGRASLALAFHRLPVVPGLSAWALCYRAGPGAHG